MPVPKVRITKPTEPKAIDFHSEINQLVIGGDGNVVKLPATILGGLTIPKISPDNNLYSVEVLPDVSDDNFIQFGLKVMRDYLIQHYPVTITDTNGNQSVEAPPVLDALYNLELQHEIFINWLYVKYKLKIPETQLLSLQELYGLNVINNELNNRTMIIILAGLLLVQYRRMSKPVIAQSLLSSWPLITPLVLQEVLTYLATLQDEWVRDASIDIMTNIESTKGLGDVNIYKQLIQNYRTTSSLQANEASDSFANWASQLLRIIPLDKLEQVKRYLIETTNKDIRLIYNHHFRYPYQDPVVIDVVRKGNSYLKAESIVQTTVSLQTAGVRYPLLLKTV